MGFLDVKEEEGWFEVRDEEGRTAALRPIATIVWQGKVYSLMGAIRLNTDGEGEGGLVLVRQNKLKHGEGTRYEVVGDENEKAHVMDRVISALLTEAGDEARVEQECPHGDGPQEFCICDDEALLQ